jgi:hypothetical protein
MLSTWKHHPPDHFLMTRRLSPNNNILSQAIQTMQHSPKMEALNLDSHPWVQDIQWQDRCLLQHVPSSVKVLATRMMWSNSYLVARYHFLEYLLWVSIWRDLLMKKSPILTHDSDLVPPLNRSFQPFLWWVMSAKAQCNLVLGPLVGLNLVLHRLGVKLLANPKRCLKSLTPALDVDPTRTFLPIPTVYDMHRWI